MRWRRGIPCCAAPFAIRSRESGGTFCDSSPARKICPIGGRGPSNPALGAECAGGAVSHAARHHSRSGHGKAAGLFAILRLPGRFVRSEVEGPVTLRSVLNALEARDPMLRGTIRDQVTGKRRDFLRFFACQEDLSDRR